MKKFTDIKGADLNSLNINVPNIIAKIENKFGALSDQDKSNFEIYLSSEVRNLANTNFTNSRGVVEVIPENLIEAFAKVIAIGIVAKAYMEAPNESVTLYSRKHYEVRNFNGLELEIPSIKIELIPDMVGQFLSIKNKTVNGERKFDIELIDWFTALYDEEYKEASEANGYSIEAGLLALSRIYHAVSMNSNFRKGQELGLLDNLKLLSTNMAITVKTKDFYDYAVKFYIEKPAFNYATLSEPLLHNPELPAQGENVIINDITDTRGEAFLQDAPQYMLLRLLRIYNDKVKIKYANDKVKLEAFLKEPKDVVQALHSAPLALQMFGKDIGAYFNQLCDKWLVNMIASGAENTIEKRQKDKDTGEYITIDTGVPYSTEKLTECLKTRNQLENIITPDITF